MQRSCNPLKKESLASFNAGGWSPEVGDNTFPHWDMVSRALLWSSPEWAPFRAGLAKEIGYLAMLPPAAGQSHILVRRPKVADDEAQSSTPSAFAEDLTNDSIPVMRIYKETGTGDVPTDVRDLPSKAVCFSLTRVPYQ